MFFLFLTLAASLKIQDTSLDSKTMAAMRIRDLRGSDGNSCALRDLFNKYGSDKAQRHNYQRAYCPIFEPIKDSAKLVVELGCDAGAGTAAFSEYFKNAELFGVNRHVKQTLSVEAHRPDHSHYYDVFDLALLNSTTQLMELNEIHGHDMKLPEQDIDVLFDDADHILATQVKMFQMWFPRVKPGGYYIIEDIFVTPIPWDGWDTPESRIPNDNENHPGCVRVGSEKTKGEGAIWPDCQFPQRPADHPFVDEKRMPAVMKEALKDREYYFTITGVHNGGGLDMTMVIKK